MIYIYERTSTDKQTLAQQRNNIENYLKLKGLKSDKIISDEGISGGISYKNRKLNDLLNEMNEGDVLIVAEISRLGRSMSDLNKLVNDELKPRKIRLIIISMNLDLDCSKLKAIDEMILFAFSFSAQIEKEMLQERTKNALEARKKELNEKGFFISKKGNRITKFGRLNGCNNDNAIRQSAAMRKGKAKSNQNNIFLWNYFEQYKTRNKCTLATNDWKVISSELNKLGITTNTGKTFTPLLVCSTYRNLTNLYKY